jgi:hypothetical protein
MVSIKTLVFDPTKFDHRQAEEKSLLVIRDNLMLSESGLIVQGKLHEQFGQRLCFALQPRKIKAPFDMEPFYNDDATFLVL